MRFGETLRSAIYEPWKSNYIDYTKLKILLREDDVTTDESRGKSKAKAKASWTEQDESTFVDELVNVQLEKVDTFHNETHSRLREATSTCESQLEQIAKSSNDEESEEVEEKDVAVLKDVLKKLDNVTAEINQLEKYRRVNYTGFLKAAKKHDRLRGSKYRVRPLLQVRLAAMPFHSEDYSSLLYRYEVLESFTAWDSYCDAGSPLCIPLPVRNLEENSRGPPLRLRLRVVKNISPTNTGSILKTYSR